MKRMLMAAAAALCLAGGLKAQSTAEEFHARYNSLTQTVGAAGLGVETLLNKWAKAFPDDNNMFQARFLFYFTKSQSSSVQARSENRYLGMQPLLNLKDSLGTPVYYFQVTSYDDELFGQAIKEIDRAIQSKPNDLDLRFAKISALIGYEKDSPDMACSELKSLMDYNGIEHPKWSYADSTVTGEYFSAAMQDYCFTFFKYATPASYKAFKELSEKMNQYEPDNSLFLDNLGTYYFVCENDCKTALKYYTRVLKKNPDDLTAIRNLVLLARHEKDVKLQKKYLPMLIKYAPDDITRQSAQAQLDALK